MTWRAARALRGGAAAAAATLIALTMHVTAGGTAPDPLLTGGVALLCAMLGIPLIGRRPSLIRLSVVVAGSQAALHGAFAVLGAPTEQMTVVAGPVGHHAAMGPSALAAGLPAIASPAHAAMSADPGMALAHLLAAVATVAALSRGESVLRVLLAPMLDRIAASADLLPGPAPLRLPAPRHGARRRPARPALSPRSLRGPPALAMPFRHMVTLF